jgi:hypothetical protein
MDYGYSRDGEHYRSVSGGTEQEALDQARREILESEPDAVCFWFGAATRPDAATFYPDVNSILDGMHEFAHDHDLGGEVADDWLNKVEPEHQTELELGLHAALTAWFDAHPEYKPRWFIVEKPRDERVAATG